jgi:hypothetical protein
MSRSAIARFALVLVLVVALFGLSVPSSAETITLRTGGGLVPYTLDPNWHYLSGPVAAPFPAAFTSTDFANALAGPSATIIAPGVNWNTQLSCDTQAQWMSVNASAGPASALYGRTFNVETCCIESATMRYCRSAENYIGDFFVGGANPYGVYFNGVPVEIAGGGTPGGEGGGSGRDVTSLLHCGVNTVHIYNRDTDGGVSAVMMAMIIEIVACPVKTESSTWGKVKALYR